MNPREAGEQGARVWTIAYSSDQDVGGSWHVVSPATAEFLRAGGTEVVEVVPRQVSPEQVEAAIEACTAGVVLRYDEMPEDERATFRAIWAATAKAVLSAAGLTVQGEQEERSE